MENGIKTIEQAISLPEIENEYYLEKKETLSNGITITKYEIMPLSPRPIHGDDIILFTDKDGRAMKIVNTPSGYAKTEFRL